MDTIQKYIANLKDTLDQLPIDAIDQVIQVLTEARFARKQIFIMGNGGSASTASHFVCDLAKNTRQNGLPSFRVTSLNENMATLTAYANDEGYDTVFANQLANHVESGDVVIGISTSGKSPNVLRAIETAKEYSAITIGFTGFDGGFLGDMVDIHVHIPSDRIEQVEDVHLMLEHLICTVLKEEHRQMTISLDSLCLLSPELVIKLDLHNLLRRILLFTVSGIGATSGSVLVMSESGNVIEGTVAYAGQVLSKDAHEFAEVFESGLAGWVFENRTPALVKSTRDDPRWFRRDWDDDLNTPRSAISVPLIAYDRVVGVLTLVHEGIDKFKNEDLALITAITACMSLASVTESVN